MTKTELLQNLLSVTTHDELMVLWRQWHVEQGKDRFILDGIVSPHIFKHQSEPRICFINKNILFEDYSRSELISIFKSFCTQNDMVLTAEAEHDIDCYLEWLISNKPDNFANGREMRYLFETMYSNQANRLVDEIDITDDALA